MAQAHEGIQRDGRLSRAMIRSSITGCSVYPREILQAAFAVNACACILAHVHPSGSVHPIEGTAIRRSK